MTQQEFEHAVATHDQRIIDAAIDRIPSNINRTGATYRRLTKEIRMTYANKIRCVML